MEKENINNNDSQQNSDSGTTTDTTVASNPPEAANDEGQTHPKIDMSRIYPTPVQPGATIGPRPYLEDHTASGSSEVSRPMVIAVTILGVYTIVAPFLYLVAGLLMTGALQGDMTSLSALLFPLLVNPVYLISILVGVGILLHKELARIAAIIIIVVSIMTSLYGVFALAQTASVNSGEVLMQIPSTITATSSSMNQSLVILQIVWIIMNILLLVFITRPGVKRQFH